MPKTIKTLLVTVNEEPIYLTVRNGVPHLDERVNTGSEQCEGCGEDIIEMGRARLYHPARYPQSLTPDVAGTLECVHCGATYRIVHAELRADQGF